MIQSEPRTPAVIAAEIQALVAELAAATTHGPTPVRTPVQTERVLPLKRAADEVGWADKTLRRHIVRANAETPHDPLAYQPGGLSNAPWRVRMDRLTRYIRDLPPGHGGQP